MREDMTGFIQIGEIYGKARYKFIGEVIINVASWDSSLFSMIALKQDHTGCPLALR